MTILSVRNGEADVYNKGLLKFGSVVDTRLPLMMGKRESRSIEIKYKRELILTAWMEQ